eukprot:gene6277-1699_t
MPTGWTPNRYADGLRMPALLVPDGVTYSVPLTEAYKRRVIDAPLIVSSMAQECGFSPGQVVSGQTPAQFTDTLQTAMGFAGADFGAMVSAEYAPVIATGRQLAFDTIAADAGVTCGNVILARAAAAGLSAPVYSIYNTMRKNN